MLTRLTVATALAGTLLSTCLVSGSAQASSVPVLKGDATPGIVTLVGRGGDGDGRGGGGGGGGQGGGGGGHYGGDGGGKHYGGGGGGGRHYGRGGDKHYGHGGGKHYGYGYGWYGVPYGYYGGGCGGLYRKAIATRSPYWWNRYYQCTGYY